MIVADNATRRRRLACFAAALLGLAPASAATAQAAEEAAMLLPGSINDQSWNALGYQVW